ncbi:RagB/SusD family nutrient uptake outer membrane protein [Dysgonomonas capnocytophagoides]|nr:RagB/SusD family nutrient uptake outer membrane protein [Dysgonomonas capnocytophagoides]
MKVNKILATIGVVTGSLFLNSCEDVLDKKPLDLIPENAVWQDGAMAQANINGLYENLHFFSHWNGDPITYNGSENSYNSECQSDMFWGHWLSARGKDDTGWTTSTNFGWDAFGLVRKTNIAIANLSNEENRKAMGTTTADDLLGQAYLLKASFYFMQARKYGGWIIVDEVLDNDGANAGKDENAAQKLKLPRATMKETYDYIIDLCKKAAGLLNENPKTGLLPKGAAYALLSEVCLHGASYIDYFENTVSDADIQAYYKKSIKAVEDLDALGKYSLVSGSENFRKMCCDYDYAPTCPENIFSIQRSELYTRTDSKYVHIHRLLVKAWTSALNDGVTINTSFQSLDKGYKIVNDAQAQIQPDPAMVEKAYYIVDSDGKAKRFEESKLFADNIDIVTEKGRKDITRTKRKLKANSSYTSISDLLYKNRDKRFYATFIYDGGEFLGNTIYFRTGGNYHRDSYTPSSQGREFGSQTGILYQKKIPQYRDMPSNSPINVTYPIFRLGRCYLNAAEAYLSLGNETKAKEYINKTRVQHGGLPALTSESGGELKMIYLDERAAELNLENDRYFTLLRTGLSWGTTDPATGYPTGAKGGIIPELNRGDNPTKKLEIEVPGNYMVEADFMKPNAYYYRELPTPQSDHNFIFTAKKRYLLPVPQSELDQNPNLWQNDNWK